MSSRLREPCRIMACPCAPPRPRRLGACVNHQASTLPPSGRSNGRRAATAVSLGLAYKFGLQAGPGRTSGAASPPPRKAPGVRRHGRRPGERRTRQARTVRGDVRRCGAHRRADPLRRSRTRGDCLGQRDAVTGIGPRARATRLVDVATPTRPPARDRKPRASHDRSATARSSRRRNRQDIGSDFHRIKSSGCQDAGSTRRADRYRYPGVRGTPGLDQQSL